MLIVGGFGFAVYGMPGAALGVLVGLVALLAGWLDVIESGFNERQ
jgi:uncharacterized membrane protein HdeD (DUF308 family)